MTNRAQESRLATKKDIYAQREVFFHQARMILSFLNGVGPIGVSERAVVPLIWNIPGGWAIAMAKRGEEATATQVKPDTGEDAKHYISYNEENPLIVERFEALIRTKKPNEYVFLSVPDDQGCVFQANATGEIKKNGGVHAYTFTPVLLARVENS